MVYVESVNNQMETWKEHRSRDFFTKHRLRRQRGHQEEGREFPNVLEDNTVKL